MDRILRLLTFAVMSTHMDGGMTTRYKRLPGRGPRREGFFSPLLSRCYLYLGDDHILAVETNGLSEDYKRFYFADIQAIITRKTRRREVWSVALGLIIAGSLLGALWPEKEPVRIFFWALAAAFLLLFLINILRGPTCICNIMTAVQQEQLPSLNRLRVARRVIDTLKIAVAKAQGVLSPEEINRYQSEEVAIAAPSSPRFPGPEAKERFIRHEEGTVHAIAFGLMVLDGVLTGIEVFHHALAITAVSSMLTLIYSVGIVIALAKQYGSDIPGAVRSITWVSLGLVCVSYFLGYIVMVTTFIGKRPKELATEWELYRTLLDLSPKDSPFLMAIYVFSAAASLIVGALGLVQMKRHREDSAGALRPGQDPGSGPLA